MSSGCAPIAMASLLAIKSVDIRTTVRVGYLVTLLRIHLYRPAAFRRSVRRKYDFVTPCRLGKTCQRHFSPFVQRVEKGFELRLIGVVRRIARVQHLHCQGAPGMPVGAQLHRAKLVTKEAPLAADQLRMKVF